jgi:hypothetical protein
MRERRFLVALLTAVLVSAGIARADCYIYGNNGLKPWDANKCRTISGGFRCAASATAVSFRDAKRNNGCAVSVKSQGSNGRWTLTPMAPRGWATWTCSITQVGSNTYQIYPPQ